MSFLKIFIFALAAFLGQTVYSLNVQSLEKEIGIFLHSQYDRNFLFQGAVSAIGAAELNEKYAVRSGIYFGKTAFDTDIKTFVSAGINPWTHLPLYFRLAYMYNGLPEYDVHSHTALPVVAYGGRRAGIALGTSLRFTSFFGEPALFESILSISVYVNFINNESLRIGIEGSNFNDFFAGNMGDYAFTLNSAVRLHERWFLINDFTVMQSGSVGLSAVLYGIALRVGVQVAW